MKNVVIAGFGNIGPVHASAIKKLGITNLYGVCDTDSSQCEKFKELYGGKTFSDFDDVLADNAVDIIHVCTPHYLHYEMTKKALCAGREVVLEKPATMKKDEFDTLLKEFDNPRVCVMFQNRLNNCVIKMKEIIDAEDIGALKAARGVVTWHRDKAYYDSAAWRGTMAYEGGGVLINQAIHTVDLLCYLSGGVKSVSAVSHNHSLRGVIDVEDTVESVIKFCGGANGVFYATNAYGADGSVMLEMVFEKEALLYIDGKLIRNGEVIANNAVPLEGKPYWGAGHISVLNEFYRGINNFNLKAVENTMRTVFAMYESAKQNGKEIYI